ncbi:MAG: tetraacyldisaccharide 4'-kinase [Nitrospinales bacterium]
MNLEHLYYQIIDKERKFYHAPLFFIFRFLAIFYRGLHRLRLLAYRFGLFKSRRLAGRVISVGNLTLGGTGKTPMTLMIAEILRGHGYKPAILSRGYGGNSAQEINVVCDGKHVLLPPELVGDEPVMMAKKLKNVPILTGPNRYKTGRHALEQLGADTLILDDGFQHLALARDLNILLFDHQNPFGNGYLFPAGNLREPLNEARRADLICIMNHTGKGGSTEIEQIVPSGIPIIKTSLRLDSIIHLDSGEVQESDYLQGQPVAVFCGIAKPDAFEKMLERVQAHVVLFRPFPDHHSYTAHDLKTLEMDAKSAGAKFLLTTEKDAVKLKGHAFGLPAMKVVIELEITEGREILTQRLLNHIPG